MELVDSQPLLEWFANNYKTFGEFVMLSYVVYLFIYSKILSSLNYFLVLAFTKSGIDRQ